ncbi:MAG TPA: J domain-containing protein [Azospirillaceae bacterium]|nr:J domain-containing protein [Azospirillaceae bacterium]
MSDDPYKILGLDRTASQEDIRKAYRRLAKKHHPDLNPGNTVAEDTFKKASAAYDLLSDPEKRARFDRGEIDASGAERPQQHRAWRHYADADEGGAYTGGAGFEDFGSIFGDLFGDSGFRQGGGGGFHRRGGHGFRLRGADVSQEITVDFLEAVKGVSRRLALPTGKVVEVAIPAGSEEGQALRLKGQGLPGLEGGPPGDVLVHLHVRPHPLFERKGNDIHMDLPVTLAEAVLGARITVPTPTGKVALTIPKGGSAGTTLRLKGKGVPDPATKTPGDQYVRLRITLPNPPDSELEAFVRDWSERHPYDPRAGLET